MTDKSFHILVVDDDARLCRLLNQYLSREGYRVSTATDGKQMRRIFEHDTPDLIVLDLLFPHEDGLTLAKELRTISDIGIIILTGKHEPVDKIVGLEIGADDYVTKPFDDRELLARIRSVLRRISHSSKLQNKEDYSTAHFTGWTLNLVTNELFSLNGNKVNLTSYEFQLLRALVLNANQTISRHYIADLITGRDWVSTDRSIDVLIGKLRKKLNQNTQNSSLIKTIRNKGYKFTSDVKFE